MGTDDTMVFRESVFVLYLPLYISILAYLRYHLSLLTLGCVFHPLWYKPEWFLFRFWCLFSVPTVLMEEVLL